MGADIIRKRQEKIDLMGKGKTNGRLCLTPNVAWWIEHLTLRR